jgi:WhiB family transcriptional regulator, redox-sensing transcriptional regulator
MTRARMPRPHEVAIARRDPRLLEAIQERRTDEAWRTRGVWGGTTPRERRAMLVAWRERVGPGGETLDDDTDEEDRRLLSLTPVSR